MKMNRALYNKTNDVLNELVKSLSVLTVFSAGDYEVCCVFGNDHDFRVFLYLKNAHGPSMPYQAARFTGLKCDATFPYMFIVDYVRECLTSNGFKVLNLKLTEKDYGITIIIDLRCLAYQYGTSSDLTIVDETWTTRGFAGGKIPRDGLLCVTPEMRELMRVEAKDHCRAVDTPNLEPIIQPAAFKKVTFSGPCTIVEWQDNTKTIVRCQEGDTFDPEKGLAMAIAKKALGNNSRYYNVFSKHLDGCCVKQREDDNSAKRSITDVFNEMMEKYCERTGFNDALDKLSQRLGVNDSKANNMPFEKESEE